MNLQDLFESTGDAKFDAMIKSIKQGTKKQATADRREREAQSRERARAAFGVSPADRLSVRGQGVAEGSYTTEKQILTRIRQIMYDRKLSGTDSNAGELLRLKQQLKDLRSQQGVSEGGREHGSAYDRGAADSWYGRPYNPQKYSDAAAQAEYKAGYDENESQASMRKDYDDDRELDQDRDQLDEDGRTVEVVVSDGTKRYQRRVRVGTNTKNLESSIVKYYQKLGLPVISIDGKKVSAAVAETNDSRVCPECGGPIFKSRFMAEEQDACYRKVKSRYKVWPSAYASGALVQCRKKGAANWGNKSK